jgi:hypothetical protein
MNAVKGKGMSFIVIFIVLVMYNVVAFVIPFARGGNFWCGYGFSMAAIILTAAVGFYAIDKESLKSKVYGVPLAMVAWRYLVVQLIAGFVEMAAPSIIPYKYGIALNTILLGGSLIGFIAVDAGKEMIEKIDEKIKEKVFYVKSLQADIEGLVGRASDGSVKKLLEDLAETIRYSDPMSSPQLAALENKIEGKAAGLAEAVGKGDAGAVTALCEELQLLFADRNRKCKILK